jgi:hypothetical protein
VGIGGATDEVEGRLLRSGTVDVGYDHRSAARRDAISRPGAVAPPVTTTILSLRHVTHIVI